MFSQDHANQTVESGRYKKFSLKGRELRVVRVSSKKPDKKVDGKKKGQLPKKEQKKRKETEEVRRKQKKEPDWAGLRANTETKRPRGQGKFAVREMERKEEPKRKQRKTKRPAVAARKLASKAMKQLQ